MYSYFKLSWLSFLFHCIENGIPTACFMLFYINFYYHLLYCISTFRTHRHNLTL